MDQQNFKNHVRYVPGFHFFVLPVLALNFGWSLYAWKRGEFSAGGLVAVLTAAALILAVLFGRLFALSVQNRVIRLEERLRYERVLPADLVARCGELSVRQIVALRFASDAELPGLMRQVLEQRLANGKAIKMQVKDWKADHLRA
jgi:uncharacterized membrane protein YciS (DUF1049 family)